jgi:hypothetical protein
MPITLHYKGGSFYSFISDPQGDPEWFDTKVSAAEKAKELVSKHEYIFEIDVFEVDKQNRMHQTGVCKDVSRKKQKMYYLR